MAEPAAAAPPLSELDRLTGVLFDPKPAFADIAARPQGWWLPLLLVTLLVLGFVVAFSQRVGWERFLRQQMQSNSRLMELPTERREEILQQQLRFVPIFAHVQAGLAFAVIAVVVAGAFLFVFNVLLGAQMNFRQVFTVTCYGLLPQALGTALATVMVFVKDPADFDLEHPLASNVGAFLDPNTAPKWLVSLASSLDLFSVWTLLLLATGFAAAARKISWSKAFTWVVATWMLWLVVKSTAVWIFS